MDKFIEFFETKGVIAAQFVALLIIEIAALQVAADKFKDAYYYIHGIKTAMPDAESAKTRIWRLKGLRKSTKY